MREVAIVSRGCTRLNSFVRIRARIFALAASTAAIVFTVGPALAAARPARHSPPGGASSATRERASAVSPDEGDDPTGGDPAGGDPFVGAPANSDSGSSDLIYTALGDSFSSGEGSGDYYDTTCDRSLNAWPARLSVALGITQALDFDLAACTGATSATIQSGQMLTLNSSTNVVSITAGGNDAAYGPALEACASATVLSPTGVCPQATLSNAAATAAALAAQTAWRAALAAAPSAVLLIMGYPDIWSTTDPSCASNNGMRADVVAAFSASTQLLDAKLATAAQLLQGDVPNRTILYVDPNADGGWSQHTICASVPWANGISLTHPKGSFHPNSAGNLELCADAMSAITDGEWSHCGPHGSDPTIAAILAGA